MVDEAAKQFGTRSIRCSIRLRFDNDASFLSNSTPPTSAANWTPLSVMESEWSYCGCQSRKGCSTCFLGLRQGSPRRDERNKPLKSVNVFLIRIAFGFSQPIWFTSVVLYITELIRCPLF